MMDGRRHRRARGGHDQICEVCGFSRKTGTRAEMHSRIMITVIRSVALPAAARACSDDERSGSPNG
eukprot:9493102-Pyramimonas_sp.AAC.1